MLFGIEIRPRVKAAVELATTVTVGPYCAQCLNSIMEDWAPLVFTINNVNRSIGKADLYPFELSSAVSLKLSFIHQLVNVDRRSEVSMSALDKDSDVGLVA